MRLSVQGVSKSFGRHEVLKDVCLEVASGELCTVLGRSGCGKTTLLRVIAGLLPAGQGRLALGGRDITSLPPDKRRVSLVPQEGALFPHLTVAGNVGFGLRRAERGRVPGLLDLVGVTELAARMPHEISGGQAQRVALARALAVEPDLILLDEPFSALDNAARLMLRAEVRSLLLETGTTAILVTHDQEEALSLSDQVVLMAQGRVLQSGTPQEVYQKPANLTAARLTGSVQTLEGEGSGARAHTLLGDVALQSPAQGAGTVLLRPEQLRPARDPEGDWEVAELRFHGETTDLGLRHLSMPRGEPPACPPGRCADTVPGQAEQAPQRTVVARTQQTGWQVGDRLALVVQGAATFQGR